MPKKEKKEWSKNIKTSSCKKAQFFCVCSESLQFQVGWQEVTTKEIHSRVFCFVLSSFFPFFPSFFPFCYFCIGFNTFNQAWITLCHYQQRSHLQIAPFWNIKCTEITRTRLNRCTCSSSSWCTDGQRVLTDSRDKIIMIMRSGGMEEDPYKALNVISHLFFHKFSHSFPNLAKPPRSFPTHSSATIKGCPYTHHLMFVSVCACVLLLPEKIRPHQRCSPGDTSGIPGMLVGSCADFWDHSPCITSLFWGAGTHERVVNFPGSIAWMSCGWIMIR